VFTAAEREELRAGLIAAARDDVRVSAAATTGSAAAGHTDRWSDIDLALAIAPEADFGEVLADWTGRMYAAQDAVAHLDVPVGARVYRVFLLASTLQVDVAFCPEAEFGATAPTFRLLFGTARDDLPATQPPAAAGLVGMGWLYALHARSSIERGRVWQAEYMISGIRDHVLALACVRHGVPAYQGRGMDSLPPELTAPLAGLLVRSLDVPELRRAFAAAVEALLAEARLADPATAARLDGPLRELARNNGAADHGAGIVTV
jgi:hypothetical protein